MRRFPLLTLTLIFTALSACGSKRNSDPSLTYSSNTDTDFIDETISANASEEEIRAYVRYYSKSGIHRRLGEGLRSGSSVVNDALKGQEIAPKPIEWSKEQLEKAYQLARETVFLKDFSGNNRRIPWLYPDDGCFARAEAASSLIFERLKLPKPNRVYAFGVIEDDWFTPTLTAATRNHKDGKISWWYHVAPTVRVDSIDYVIDPSLDSKAPLTLEAWQAAQKAFDGKIGVSVICDENAYNPGNQCVGGSKKAGDNPTRTRPFFEREWERMIELGHSPEKILLGKNFIQP